jgi:hypothetical protein
MAALQQRLEEEKAQKPLSPRDTFFMRNHPDLFDSLVVTVMITCKQELSYAYAMTRCLIPF